MNLAVTLVIGIGKALLWVLQICMLLRAVLSWFPLKEDNPFLGFVTMVTEPIVAPVRNLFDRFGWFEDLPIDMAFFTAYILLALVSTLLTVLF